MMYTFVIYGYGFLLKIAALFHSKAKKWIRGRKNFWTKLPDLKNKNVIWFHCASLGEYDQGKPIIEAWKKEHPHHFILITFFSPSGYEHIIDKSVGDFTCYLPLDTKRNSRRFIQQTNPQKAFFIKYEIWVNHLQAAFKNGTEIYSISSVFRPNHHFFKWYGKTFKQALYCFQHFFVQTKESKRLLQSIGIENCTISGDTRYDRVLNRAQEPASNEIISAWTKSEKVFVMGSTWEVDEKMILPYINDYKINQKVILAPHEVDDDHIKSIKRKIRVSYQCYSDIQAGIALKDTTHILILDCIGVLADAYQYGNIAYVGGGFGTGLHNILEPASFGLPVIFGPLHHQFPEATDFIAKVIGKSCTDKKVFIDSYHEYRNQPSITEKVKQFMQVKSGATEIVLAYFKTS